jgi:hypothetical protein
LVALVVAESRGLAEDACELITVDYDPLPPVATYEAALDPIKPALFDDLGDRGAVVDYDSGSGELTYYAASQSPQGLRPGPIG